MVNVGGREIPASKKVIEKAMTQCRKLIEKGFQVEHYTQMLTEYQTALHSLKKPRANNGPAQPSRSRYRAAAATVRRRRISYYRWEERLGLDQSTDVPHDDEYYVMAQKERPRIRQDCRTMSRPCPFVGCRYNLWMDVRVQGKSAKYKPLIKPNRPDKTPWEMPPGQSCVLDVAEADGLTLEDLGELMTLTRERVRQIETIALTKLKKNIAPLVTSEDLEELDIDTNWDMMFNESH
jgi:hypothetical protein